MSQILEKILEGHQINGFREEESEENTKILPYVAFSINQACLLRCVYCCPGGEANASTRANANFDDIKKRASIAIEEGISKFRITGGEPFLHPEIKDILKYFSNLEAISTINTAAFLTVKQKEVVKNLGPNISFITSLDSRDKKTFKKITKRGDLYKKTIEGIEYLAANGLLKRINMVVIRDNIDHVFDMITYCGELGCNLKISDIAKTTDSFGRWQDHYANINELEKELEKRATAVQDHPYTKRLGIPTKIYSVNGVDITVKSSSKGTSYLEGEPCNTCDFFPCEEGLYFINVLPDGDLSGCRFNIVNLESRNDFRSSLREMMQIFQNVVHIEKLSSGNRECYLQ